MKLFFSLLPLLFSFLSFSQQSIKFKDVSRQELEMKYCAFDSSASAVVLYDKGEFRQDGKFIRHRRIKVLKHAGKSYANLTLKTPSKGSISAFVYNLENDQIVESKLTNSSIYTEELFDGFHVYKIFLPNVKVGSVIDIRYMHYGIPFEWRFQETIPIVYNELKLEKTQYVIFEKQQRGFGKIDVIGNDHYMVKDVPAFVVEPFVSHYSNYVTKFEFQLTKIAIPGYFYENISTSWPTISEKLMESYQFGHLIKSTSFLKDSVKLWKKTLTKEQRMQKAYSYMRDEISWNGNDRLFGSELLNKKLKTDKQGTSADINLTLIALLRELELEAYPVVLSTRDNGLLNPLIPNLWNLNYVLAYAESEEGGIVLDATDKNLIMGMIPEKCLNGQGWLITDEKEGEWISLKPSRISEVHRMVNMVLDEDHLASINVSQKKSNYYFLDWHENYNNSSDESIAAQLADKYQIEVDSYDSKVKANKAVVMESFKADVTESITDLGRDIYIDPFLFCSFSSNPYVAQARIAPVDLGHRFKERATINITIPEGLTLSELPKSEAVNAFNNGMVFTINYSMLNNKIQVQYSYEVNNTLYSQEEYGILRDFHSYIIDKINKPIHLVKKT